MRNSITVSSRDSCSLGGHGQACVGCVIPHKNIGNSSSTQVDWLWQANCCNIHKKKFNLIQFNAKIFVQHTLHSTTLWNHSTRLFRFNLFLYFKSEHILRSTLFISLKPHLYCNAVDQKKLFPGLHSHSPPF